MSKIRVYELAAKLGLENKELLARLKKAGVEAKTHMSMLDESDVQQLEADQAPKETEAPEIEERRISSGIIRRRRKEKAPAVKKEAKAEEKAVQKAEAEAEAGKAPEVAEVPAEKPAEPRAVEPVSAEAAPAAEKPAAAKEEPAPAEPVAKTEAEAEAEAEAAKAATPEETPAPAVEEPAKEAAPKTEEPGPARIVVEEPTKVTANRAKILGRVELPQSVVGTPSAGKRDRTGKPARPAGGRPARQVVTPVPAPADLQAPGKEGRGKKKKKGKGADQFADRRGDRRSKRARMEVFEPERGERYRKLKKASKQPKKTEITVSKAIKRKIRIADAITVGELAKRMGVKANDLIRELMSMGNMVTINHPLDFETAEILAAEFNYEVENVGFDEEAILNVEADGSQTEDKLEDLVERPPVVTIMGHVDHGKTSLLDAIRETNVIAGEAGGITQHIGAYDVELDGRKIAFLDTPGHEAFTAMRARGAKVTDIVVLVVAADDGVMPQTKEAINHAKAAGVPIVVAVNKIDKPGANPDKVKQELTEFELVPEEWGGDTIFVEVSAKEKINIDGLLEMILLQAEVLELKANPNKRASGAVVEARLDRGRGPVATVLVQAGTLRVGDPIVSGIHWGRVRTMINDRGEQLKEAAPSTPVEITGLSGVPDAGDTFHAVKDEKSAKEVAQHRAQKLREAELAKTSKISLEQLYARIQQGDVKELKVIIKADVQGSVEAVRESLLKLSTDECRLVVIHTAVGGITESDISLASASDAIVLGFNVRPEPKAATMAEAEGVDIRLYNIIYDAVADIKNAMEGLLAPTMKEVELGRVEVRETFHISKIGTIAGCYVLEGKVTRNAHVRLVRDSVVIYEGKLSSLKRFKDDAREVAAGYECGIGLENYNDIKVGDIIEAFEIEEVKTTLEG
ncbi:translation initiation factor 2 (bIF-2) [Geothermobacter ehrlichii]|uniref:Translation initiation factor IF-2 n=1 Tax=Geothermobacter ehrlichii TaxID=213224 RepID=A0A5D3WNB7_9BACT|nr:translation initiation factor IF-2 [Geothermobacter ehrlichii]TYO99715.1 translation initiation factor 2 (bIF-2) [Geothermobacter ehrlichii]